MIIFALDDEAYILEDSLNVLRGCAADADIHTFNRATACLDFIKTTGTIPDIVFSDVEMPGMSGLDFARRLKELAPDVRLIFVTGFSEYAVDAFIMRADGYILKPLHEEHVMKELSFINSPAAVDVAQVKVVCFGEFEVLWQDKPLKFTGEKEKELMAFLVDKKGDGCTSEEIAEALSGDGKQFRKSDVRRIIQDLTATLKECGILNAVTKIDGLNRLDQKFLDCDYFRMLAGDAEAKAAYNGEYMKQYPWAEKTKAVLDAM